MSLKHLVRSKKEIDSIRQSGAMLAHVLTVLRGSIEADMSTHDIDEIARKEIKALGGKPSFYGYNGFPGAVCASINDEVVHGIPSRHRVMKAGDLVSFDCGVTYNGMVTDAAFTEIVGGESTVSKRVVELVNTTKQSLQAGENAVHGDVAISEISKAIEDTLQAKKFGIVKDLVGHGVGRKLHEEPDIPNYVTGGKSKSLLSGMTIAIEPMATLGTDRVTMDSDGWTIRTQDGSLSAHFEQTVLVTEEGVEILTDFL
ncbi:TPA: type I methionyl aminopeptidase [Candidatus Saccharibacteria bacterium]|nr:type I methionyl aminopeptidase [Candidatus Saccharibacteria bacterium]HIO87198.1 type I methionyl aminopeptidase [Candidatus Saccharibacteria bacterium]